jgi:hypothetical protein
MTKKAKVKDKDVPKILIAVAILSWSHEFAMSFLNFWTELMTYQHKGRRFHVGFKFVYRRPARLAQEELAQYAVDTGCTHILYIDDDILDLKVENLLKLLDADKESVGGVMFTGGFPYAMCAFRRYDTTKAVADMPIVKGIARLYELPPDQRVGVQKVDLISFGFHLMKTSMFKGRPKPWFKHDAKAPTDSYLADDLLKRGESMHAHFDVWLNHRGVTRENRDLYFQIGMQAQQNQAVNQLIQLTPEEMQVHEKVMTKRLEEAETRLKKVDASKQKFYDKKHNKTIPKLVKNKEK